MVLDRNCERMCLSVFACRCRRGVLYFQRAVSEEGARALCSLQEQLRSNFIWMSGRC